MTLSINSIPKKSLFYRFIRNSIFFKACVLFYPYQIYFKNQINIIISDKMGSCIQTSSICSLTVGTLNYSGILTSPYEFFERQDSQQLLISDKFRQVVKQKYPNFDSLQDFSWDMGSIDSHWKNRFAPINSIEVGINPQTGKMMTEEQFSKQWERVHQLTRQSLIKTYFQVKYPGSKQMNEMISKQVQMCRQFDLLCYRTMLLTYCGVKNTSKMSNNVSSENYREKKKLQFQKSYLIQSHKVNSMLSSLKKNKPDIILIQESGPSLANLLKASSFDYHVLSKVNNGSIILLKKSKWMNQNFQSLNETFLQMYSQKLKGINVASTPKDLDQVLNFNNDTIYQYLGEYLLINVHLASQAKRNEPQLEQLIKQYWRISEMFPSLKIICGGDFNNKITLQRLKQKQKIQKAVEVTPKGSTIFTVKKKRTYMQPQRRKANVVDEKAKDFLISNLKIKQQKVMLMNGQVVQKLQQFPYLPCQQHPYDHLLIYASYIVE